MSELKIGTKGEAQTVVSENNTADKLGSGAVAVFATPAMIALMEEAALSSVQANLEPGFTTVGTKINSSHIAATPMGMSVTAKSVLTEVDGKRLVFTVEAFDSSEKIGEGTHERYIVNTQKFLKKCEEKRYFHK